MYNKDTFAKNLRKYMDANNEKGADIARLLGVAKSNVTAYLAGKQVPRMDKIAALADHWGILNSDLLEEPPEPLAHSIMQPTIHKGVRIPVLGSVPAGIPIEAIEDVIDWEELPYEMTQTCSEYFALKVDGLSMYPVILDEDVVIIKKSETCTSGQICLVYVNGTDATLKRVILNDKKRTLTLKPENTNFAPRTFTAQEIEELPVRIGGYVVEIRRKIT